MKRLAQPVDAPYENGNRSELARWLGWLCSPTAGGGIGF